MKFGVVLRLRVAVVRPRLLRRRPLGVGRWLDRRQAARDRLRRRHRRPHQRRYRGPRAHDHHGQAGGLAQGADEAAQRALRPARCRSPVVRLDRLQRRFRAGRRPRRRLRDAQLDRRHRGRDARLARGREDPGRSRDHPRCGLRPRRRPRRHHPGLRLRQRRWARSSSASSPAPSAPAVSASSSGSASTTRSTSSPSTSSAASSARSRSASSATHTVDPASSPRLAMDGLFYGGGLEQLAARPWLSWPRSPTAAS